MTTTSALGCYDDTRGSSINNSDPMAPETVGARPRDVSLPRPRLAPFLPPPNNPQTQPPTPAADEDGAPPIIQQPSNEMYYNNLQSPARRGRRVQYYTHQRCAKKSEVIMDGTSSALQNVVVHGKSFPDNPWRWGGNNDCNKKKMILIQQAFPMYGTLVPEEHCKTAKRQHKK